MAVMTVAETAAWKDARKADTRAEPMVSAKDDYNILSYGGEKKLKGEGNKKNNRRNKSSPGGLHGRLTRRLHRWLSRWLRAWLRRWLG